MVNFDKYELKKFDDVVALRAYVDQAIEYISSILHQPLNTETTPQDVNALRFQLSETESLTIHILDIRRQLSYFADVAKAAILDEIKFEKGKITVDEKEIYIKEKMAGYIAYEDYLVGVLDLIKRRCSIGQSFLNNINTEIKASFINTNI